MDKKGRVALVTGGAQGLGRAICESLAADGFTLAIGDIQTEVVRQTAGEISETFGVACLPVTLDVANEESVLNAMKGIESHFGHLDTLVCNAGISGSRAPLEEMDLADWERVIRINLTGCFMVCKAAIPLIKRNGWGRIVNMASQAARSRTGVGKAQYAASKAGIVGFSRVLADEVGRDGITVNCVAPSRTLTALTIANAGENAQAYFQAGIDLTALGRLAIPEDVAAAVSFLCSEGAGFITGTVIDVNGGAFMT